MNNKATGAFYTPPQVLKWMVSRAFKKLPERQLYHILEPSSGDGRFLGAIMRYDINYMLDCVELDTAAVVGSQEKFRAVDAVTFHRSDFLFWRAQKQYDLVIGNPPYISSKGMSKEQVEKAIAVHREGGLETNSISNIWTTFVIKSLSLLNDNGVLAFVLPNELLQVNYSKEIRELLLEQFARVEIISFKNLAFENLEQDTVIVMGYKVPKDKPGLYFSEVSDICDLTDDGLHYEKHHGALNAKWSSFILSENDIKFVQGVASNFPRVSDLCVSGAGIVTAANKYFIVTQADADKYKLHKYLRKIIQKGGYVNGSAEVTAYDYSSVKEKGLPCYLLDLCGVDQGDFSPQLKEYLEYGQSLSIPERYKCKQRQRWHDVPSVWKSEAFFFKRSHHYPKLLINDADVYVTDSAYRVTPKQSICSRSMVFSFYNTLSLLFAELDGRYYGGGVLEVTPNEFKGIPVPYLEVPLGTYNAFKARFKVKESIEEYLHANDDALLLGRAGITKPDIKRIQGLYSKVKARRMREETL